MILFHNKPLILSDLVSIKMLLNSEYRKDDKIKSRSGRCKAKLFATDQLCKHSWDYKTIINPNQNNLEYQPSGEGGTHSPPAPPHRLQNPKWPPGGPKMVDGVWKGVYP